MTVLDRARELDAVDPLARFREQFHFPDDAEGKPCLYFCGNSLGLQPKNVQDIVDEELTAWRQRAVDAHFEGERPWYSYHERFAAPLARLVGAHPDEVVAMNSLTVNLHLMMVSFYRPDATRNRILVEPFAFPSDNFAVRSQLRFHGVRDDGLLVPATADDGVTVDLQAFKDLFEAQGDRIALVLLGGVNYSTGQLYDLKAITEIAHAHGARVGVDLAHAAGNVPLDLHESGVDFAVWCSYKYLNAGPGAIAGCFVHRRHLKDRSLSRFAGWWGHDPARRFRMHLESRFQPTESADGWQLSNPPILAMAPLWASLRWFEEAGIEALRAKSIQLTTFLIDCLDDLDLPGMTILTPRDPRSRGSQLSLRFREDVGPVQEALQKAGVIVDVRKPDVIRVAPVPLYNSFHDVWRLTERLRDIVGAS